MKPIFLAIIFVFSVTSAFAQDETVSYRHFVGIVKDSENQLVAGAKVCGWDKSGRPINGRIPCTVSKADGSFALNIQKWDGDTYTIWVEDSAKGYPSPYSALFEGFFRDKQVISVDASNESNPVEIQLGAKAGRAILKIVDDVSGQPIKSGKITISRIDNPELWQSMSASFPQGRYELLTPESALTLKIELWNGNEWKEWFAMDKNNNKIELIQVKLGETKEIKIRLKQ